MDVELHFKMGLRYVVVSLMDQDRKLLNEIKRLRELLGKHYNLNKKRIDLLDSLIAFGEGVLVGKEIEKEKTKKKESKRVIEAAEVEQ